MALLGVNLGDAQLLHRIHHQEDPLSWQKSPMALRSLAQPLHHSRVDMTMMRVLSSARAAKVVHREAVVRVLHTRISIFFSVRITHQGRAT